MIIFGLNSVIALTVKNVLTLIIHILYISYFAVAKVQGSSRNTNTHPPVDPAAIGYLG